MTITNINIGTVANDGTGDTLRGAFNTVNDNFQEVQSSFASQVTEESLAITLEDYVTTQELQDITDPIGEDIASLFTGLDGKANTVHTHSISNITGLQSSLDSKATLTQLNAQVANLNNAISQINIVLADLISRIEALEA